MIFKTGANLDILLKPPCTNNLCIKERQKENNIINKPISLKLELQKTYDFIVSDPLNFGGLIICTIIFSLTLRFYLNLLANNIEKWKTEKNTISSKTE